MKRYIAEFIAAFFLVFVGVGATVADFHLSTIRVTDSFGPLGIALATGLALALGIAAVGRISGGHANPAVTIAFFVSRRIKAVDALGYIVSQLLGGIAAAFLVKRILPTDAFSNASGAPILGQGIKGFNGTAIEVILTFFLVMVIWGTAVDRRGPKHLAAFAIGLTVTFDIIVGGTFTGAAMNPARWLGPALAAGHVAKDWYVWVAGPILGALLASLVYETFFMEDEELMLLDEDGEVIEVAYTPADDEDLEAATVAATEWHDTPSTYTPPPPVGAPPTTGSPSPMVPPPPPDQPSQHKPDGWGA